MIFDSTKKAGKLSDGTAKTPAHLNYDTNELVAQLIDHYGNKVDDFVAGQTWYFNFGDEFDSEEDYELVVYVERTGPDMRSDDVYLSGKLEPLGGGDIIVEKEHLIKKSAYAKGGVKYVAKWIDKLRKLIVEAAEKKGVKRTRSSWSGQMDDSAREYYEDRVAQTWRLTPKVKEVIKELQEDYDRYLRLQQEGSHHKSGTDALLYVSNSSKSWTITNSVNFTYYEGHGGWSMIDTSYVLTEVRFDGTHYADIYTPIDVSKIKASYDKSEDYLVSVIERGNERGLNLIASLGIDTEHRSPK